MGAKAARLKLRLFLEGVEVPIIAAQIQCESNSPAVASIQIPPLPEGTRLLPRTLVHLYFLDFYETASPLLTLRGKSVRKDDGNNPSTYEQKLLSDDAEDDRRNEKYKLLFCGEIVGFQWTKSPAQRSLVLQCQDLSNYWDTAQQWENTDLFGPGYKAMFSGGSTNMFTDFLSSKDEAIVSALMTPSVQFPALKGLLGGIIHLLEKIGGSYYGEKKFGGQNIFYSLAELRLHTTQMITAYDKDDTANKLLNAQGYESLFGRVLGNLGDQVSFRKAINALMGVIFHETYPIPTPLFVPGTFGTVSGVKRTKMRNDPKLDFIPNGADAIIAGIAQLIDLVNSATVASDKGKISIAINQQKKFINELSTKAKKEKISDAPGIFSSTSALLGRAQAKINSSAWKPGAKAQAYNEIIDLLNQATENTKRAQRLEKVESNPKKAIPARLNSQIFRPDVWFTAPPRCNVIFPDQYVNLSYARNFMQEPTRLLLKTNDAFFGEDELFDQFYFAPKAVTTGSEKRNLQAVLSGEIMDHELFTGILPAFEKMSETNIFAVRSGAVDGKMPKVGLAQRTCNFLYFKYRFASRQMLINGRFNPYIAPGFPGLIVDKYVDLERLRAYNELVAQGTGIERELRDQLGTHFLANFAGVTHSVDQASVSRTDITCTYPRDFNESVEFLGAIQLDQEMKIKNRENGKAFRSTDVAALSQPPIGSLGPNAGIVTKVQDVTSIYVGEGFDEATATLPLYKGVRKAGTNDLQTRVPVGFVQAARDFGPEVEALVSNPFQFIEFKAYRITEDIPRYRLEKVDLPAEEYIRPGWYGDVWNTANVGKVYDSFFRTGSICDPTQIGDPGNGDHGFVVSEDAEDALLSAAQGKHIDDPRVFAPALLTLEEKSSIAQAVEFLVLTYSYVKQAGLDADEFIRAYTWRPIASLPDMFGSSDLTFTEDGLEVTQGIEGFHSRAFGPYEDLFGLVPPEIESILNFKTASKASKRNDTRKRKHDAVLAYISALGFSRAIVG